MDSVLWNTVDEKIRQSDIDGAIAFLEDALAREKSDHFTSLIGAQFTNPPEQVLAFINRFIGESEPDNQLKSIYLEMNGFDINYDLWFFSQFGYNAYGPDPDDLDWLSDWEYEDEEYMPLTGLEPVQADFAWYCEENDKEDESCARVHEIATLLVMVKFLALVRNALASGPLTKSVPIIATAHDFDITGRFLPASFNPNIANPVSPTTSDSDIANQSAPAFLQRCLQLIRDTLWNKREEMNIAEIWSEPFEPPLPPLTDDMLREAERRLGVKLPDSYVSLLRMQNGGYMQLDAIPTSVKNYSGEGYVPLEEIFGIDLDEDNMNSILCTPYMIDEWGLPQKLVLISGDGHCWIAMDYRVRPVDPPITYFDLEMKQEFQVAANFEAMLISLSESDQFPSDE